MAALLRISLSSFSKCTSLKRITQIPVFCGHQYYATIVAPHTQVGLINVQYKLTCHNSSQNIGIRIQTRNFMSFLKRKKSHENIREEDKLESHYDLVYSAEAVSYIQLGLGGVQVVTIFACLAVGAVALGLPSDYLVVLTEQPLEVGLFIGINFIILCGILRMCVSYPLRIYYSEIENHFMLVFVGAHPFAKRHLKVSPGEMKPNPPGPVMKVVVPWSSCFYTTPSQKTVYLNMDAFKYPVYYNKLMGYVNKPQC